MYDNRPIFTPSAPVSEKPNLRDKLRQNFKNPFVLFGLLAAIIVVIVIVAINVNHWQNSHDNQITITNLNDYVQNIPANTREDVYNAAFRAAMSNSAGQTNEALSAADAQIREGSVVSSFDPTTGLYSGNFIVDIPSLEQSYRIYYEWIDKNSQTDLVLGDYTTSVTCLHPDEYIYDFYPCIAPNESTDTAYLSYLENILPFSGYANNDVNSDAAIYISGIERTTGGTPFVRVNVNSCGDTKIMDEAMATVKNYIKDHQLNPEDYTYKLNDLCDGEAE